MSVTEDNIAADLKSATILTAADIAFLAYDTYTDGNLTTKNSGGSSVVDPVEEQLEADGWRPIVGVAGQEDTVASYQGVAFYKTIGNETEVTIGNRGSQSAYEFLVSDAAIVGGISSRSDVDALTYCDGVVSWLKDPANGVTGTARMSSGNRPSIQIVGARRWPISKTPQTPPSNAVSGSERALEQVERDRVAEIYHDLDDRVTSEPALKGDLDKARELYALKWLRAPVSGFVQKVDVTTVGQVVTLAQSLVTIVPEGTPLIIGATVTNEDIGYLKVGQPVEVKVDTFPFQRYGSPKGTLVSNSPDAEDNPAFRDSDTRTGARSKSSDLSKDPANNGRNSGYVYEVHIRAEDSHYVIDGEPHFVVSGMTVQVDITTDQRRVIDLFLSPVTKYLDEGMKVR